MRPFWSLGEHSKNHGEAQSREENDLVTCLCRGLLLDCNAKSVFLGLLGMSQVFMPAPTPFGECCSFQSLWWSDRGRHGAAAWGPVSSRPQKGIVLTFFWDHLLLWIMQVTLDMRICLCIFWMVKSCCCPMLSSSTCFHHHFFLIFFLVYLPYPSSSSPPLSHLHRKGPEIPSPHWHQSFHDTQIPPVRPQQPPEVGCLLWGPCIWSCRFAFEFPDSLCRFSAMRTPGSVPCYKASAQIVSMCWSTWSHRLCTK